MAAVAGGIVAGPKVARTAIDESVKQAEPYYGRPPAFGYGGAEATLAQDSKAYTMESLAKLKRLASGDIRDEDRNYPTEGNPEPFRALRSISENARQFMRNARYERQWKERTIKAALDALDHYDKTGILRTFF